MKRVFVRLMSIVASAATVDTAAADLIGAVNQHRVRVRSFVENSPFGQDRELADRLAATLPEELSCGDKAGLLNRIVGVGQAPLRTQGGSLLIEESTILAILGAALDDSCAEVRHAAVYWFEHEVTDQDLVPYKGALMALDSDERGAVPLVLLARLPLIDTERSELLQRARGSPAIRARLGDTTAEAEIIARFEQAATFPDKAKAARELGTAGSVVAGAALAGALKSHLVEDTDRHTQSIRFVLIEVLGLMHREEPLLNRQFRDFTAKGDAKCGGPTAVQAYVDQVYTWARGTYGVALDGPDPPAVLFQPKLIVHP